MKRLYVAASVILISLIVVGACVAFSPIENQTQNKADSRTYWMSLAQKAWQYFQPGIGVDAKTGLHKAGLYWPYITEWDIGTYIQAIIDASKLGLVQTDGQWGFNYRIGQILGFLETRKLTGNGIPYSTYDSTTGKPHGNAPTFSIDEGKLILALYNLETYRPDLKQRIDNLVYNRNNNTDLALIPNPQSWLGATDFYCYYVASAFKAFNFTGWDNVPASILSEIVSRPNVTAYGVDLPVAHICAEPLLLAAFDLNASSTKFNWLLSQVNFAQEARFEATGHYTAFSEGNTGLDDPSYVYEFIVDYDGSTFTVAPRVTPISYVKVAVGFDALFNSEYTNKMVDHIESVLPASSNGIQEGIDENGRPIGVIIDRTNGLIISAARYSIENLSTPINSESPTPTIQTSSTPSDSLPEQNTSSVSPEASSTPSTDSNVAGWSDTLLIVMFAVPAGSLALLAITLKRKKFSQAAK